MFEFQNGLLYHDSLLYVPNGLTQLQLLQAMHDTLVGSHFGFNKTMELVFGDYWQPQFWKYVKEVVRSCDVILYRFLFYFPFFSPIFYYFNTIIYFLKFNIQNFHIPENKNFNNINFLFTISFFIVSSIVFIYQNLQ